MEGVDDRALIYGNNQINFLYTTWLRLVIAQWCFRGRVVFS